jgi:hypothetical protein
MHKVLFFVLLAAGCAEQPIAGMDPGAPTTPAADVGNGVTAGGGDPGGPAALPTLDPGNYTALSNGLLGNDCLAPPVKDGMLGTWTWKTVTPEVWNLAIDPNLPPAVVTRQGDALTGDTAESGMPLWGCQMRETYVVTLTPSSPAAAAGTIETRFEVVSGNCAQYEPTLPCAQRYAIAITHE